MIDSAQFSINIQEEQSQVNHLKSVGFPSTINIPLHNFLGMQEMISMTCWKMILRSEACSNANSHSVDDCLISWPRQGAPCCSCDWHLLIAWLDHWLDTCSPSSWILNDVCWERTHEMETFVEANCCRGISQGLEKSNSFVHLLRIICARKQ